MAKKPPKQTDCPYFSSWCQCTHKEAQKALGSICKQKNPNKCPFYTKFLKKLSEHENGQKEPEKPSNEKGVIRIYLSKLNPLRKPLNKREGYNRS